jgi:hypothetical protein
MYSNGTWYELFTYVLFVYSGETENDRVLFLMKNPAQLLNVLGKLFVFAYTWSLGGNFHRQEDMDEDDNVNRRGTDKVEKDINICNEFDNFMRELFEVEPPLGKFYTYACILKPVSI